MNIKNLITTVALGVIMLAGLAGCDSGPPATLVPTPSIWLPRDPGSVSATRAALATREAPPTWRPTSTPRQAATPTLSPAKIRLQIVCEDMLWAYEEDLNDGFSHAAIAASVGKTPRALYKELATCEEFLEDTSN